MGDRLTLALGEERAVHLSPLQSGGEWTFEVEGMSSAVDVRKLWPADPYPEDDEDDEDDQADRPPPDVVFMVRATSPGKATIRFAPRGAPERAASSREVQVIVRG